MYGYVDAIKVKDFFHEIEGENNWIQISIKTKHWLSRRNLLSANHILEG